MPPMPIFSFYAIVHKDARFFAIENDKSLTLREVIDTVEAIHKRDCGCGHLVGPEAWVAGLLDDPIDDDASESSSSGSDSKSSSCHTSSSQGRRYLHPSDSVTDLTGPLVFSAVDDKSTRLPSLLLRCPRGCLHLPKRLGQTCFIQTCHAPLNLRLPEPSMCTFTSFTYRLGTIWADKTHAIDFLSGPGRYYSNRLPLIRRPSGFGKTTFVFMLMYYHDCLRACVAERLFPPTACWDPNAPEPNRHLVLYFDLSKVPLGPDFREQLIAYIREVIITFVDAYRDVLGLSESTEECVSELSSVGDFDILASLFYMIASHEETIYLVVDNYNAPRLATERLDPDGDSIETVDSCLRRYFIGPIKKAICSRLVEDGIFVGSSDIIDEHPVGPFATITYDMTYSPTLLRSFGFTDEEVVELARLLCQPNDFIEEVRRGKKVRCFAERHMARKDMRVMNDFNPRLVRYTWWDDFEANQDDPEEEMIVDSDDEACEDAATRGFCTYSMTDVIALLRERIATVEKTTEL